MEIKRLLSSGKILIQEKKKEIKNSYKKEIPSRLISNGKGGKKCCQ